MDLIKQLREPKPRAVKSPDGTDMVTWNPPTSLELRAAQELEKLIQVNQGLARALQTQENFR